MLIAIRFMGFDAVTVPDAESARDVLQRTIPSLAIVDVRLPGVNGVELAREMKANSRLSNVPVLLTSAYGRPQDAEADGFIAKPFDLASLADVISPYVRRRV
jgi:two-component system phosphate regulon response regulator PhoB